MQLALGAMLALVSAHPKRGPRHIHPRRGDGNATSEGARMLLRSLLRRERAQLSARRPEELSVIVKI